jgi:hypothetical protein
MDTATPTETSMAVRAEWERLSAEYPETLSKYHLTFNPRTSKRYGQCRFPNPHRPGSTGQIEVAGWLVKAGQLGQALDTLRHEAAHALAGKRAGHGPIWKSWCVKLGAAPEQFANDAESREALAELRPPKWEFRCPECGVGDTRRRIARDSLGYEHRTGYTGSRWIKACTLVHSDCNTPIEIRINPKWRA